MFASAGEVLGIVIVAVLAGVGIGALFLSRFVKIVQQGSVGVVKRLGEFKSVDQPGMRILVPFVDKMEKVDVREFPMTGDQQAVITKDNVSLQVSATIFCQVIDVKSALFEINDYQLAVDQLSRTALRAVFGELSLDQALSERETINSRMQDHMADATAKWGVRLNRIEILDITPPLNVVQAMSEQKEAEQHKRAAILKSEGEQQAAVNSAGGRKQAAVLEAEGAKQSAILRAEAQMKVPHPTTPKSLCPTRRRASWARRRCCSLHCATRTWVMPRPTARRHRRPRRPDRPTRSCRRTSAPSGPAERAQPRLAETEMVADLVQQRHPHPLRQFVRRAGGLADGGQEERDLVGTRAGVGAALGQWDAFVQPVEPAGRALVVDDDGHVLHFGAQRIRDRLQGVGDECFEGVDVDRIHGGNLVSNHVPPLMARRGHHPG